jgi:hypothetical protein
MPTNGGEQAPSPAEAEEAKYVDLFQYVDLTKVLVVSLAKGYGRNDWASHSEEAVIGKATPIL